VGFCVAAGAAHAGGFQIYETSTTDAGVAVAGSAAGGRDAATAYYNPAAMTLLGRSEALAGLAIVVPDTHFSARGAFDAAGNPLAGNSTVRNDASALFFGYAVWAPSPDLRLGFAVNQPFGQASQYDDAWVGRYFATLSQLTTVNLSFVTGYRVSRWLSLGGGLDVQYARADQRTAIDFGSLCFGALGPATCAAGGLTPQGADGRLRLDGDSWAVGFNVGALFEVSQSTRIGVTYRSRMIHHLEGAADYTVPAAALPLTLGGQFQDTRFTSRLALPDMVSVGVAHQATTELLLLAGATWTHWSLLHSIDASFANPAQPGLSNILDWNDGYRFAIGGQYRLLPATVLRAGIAYEISPVPDRTRSVQIPGSDRLALALGATQALGWAELSGSYTLNLDRDASVQQSSAQAGSLGGSFDRTIHVVSLQLRARF
jgi:long-chain fatty acid transport protein